MIEEIFKFWTKNDGKLKKFGFKEEKSAFVYKKDISDGEFEMLVKVYKNGQIEAKIYDKETGDEFVLHLAKEAVGAFVGEIRSQFEKTLLEVRDNCFDRDVFKGKQTRELIKYIKTKYACDLEFLWDKLPDAAIWRRKDSKKWFGVLMTISRRKLGFDSDEVVEVVDLHSEAALLEKIIDNKSVFRGYHMNKKYWLTVVLDGTLKNTKLNELVEKSYELAIKK